MAESESGQDKTEEPTEKRRREAREKGQLPRSRELNTLAILMAGAGGLLIYGADLAGALLRLMRSNFELSRETAMNTESMLQLLGASAYLAAQGLWPILLMLLVAAIVGPIALARCRRRAVVNWCGCSARNCVGTRPNSANWCPGRRARSPRKASAKSRK